MSFVSALPITVAVTAVLIGGNQHLGAAEACDLSLVPTATIMIMITIPVAIPITVVLIGRDRRPGSAEARDLQVDRMRWGTVACRLDSAAQSRPGHKREGQ